VTISFSAGAKAEICRILPNRECCALAQCFGVLLFCNSFSAEGIRIITESRELALILPKLFKKAFNLNFDTFPSMESPGKLVFQITDPEKIAAIFQLPRAEDRLAALAESDIICCNEDMLAGWMCQNLADGGRERYLPALRSRPPVWIRIQKNTDQVLRELDQNRVEWKKNDRLPDAYCLHSHANVNLCLLECYKRGCFEIQDFASQCIGYSSMAQTGEQWWDACAGGGGKTLLLATLLKEGGQVFASDIREKKLEEIKIRAQRASYNNIRYLKWNDAHKMQFDGVLTDVPCSSSGRWRRNPEMRLVCSENWLEQLTQTQYEILDKAADAVKPGGLLVYGTCSVFDQENNGVTDRFLEAHPEFEPAPFTLGGTTQWRLQVFPEDANCDGTFCARFRRKA
jgi:16S rRNA (cytosine967-C5)-methyltransferase